MLFTGKNCFYPQGAEAPFERPAFWAEAPKKLSFFEENIFHLLAYQAKPASTEWGYLIRPLCLRNISHF